MRPEIEARKLALDVLKHQIIIEKAATRPQVSAFAAYDIYSEPSLLADAAIISPATRSACQASGRSSTASPRRAGCAACGRSGAQAEAQLVATRLQVEADVRTAFDQLQQPPRPPCARRRRTSRLANETLALTTHNFDAGLNHPARRARQPRAN